MLNPATGPDSGFEIASEARKQEVVETFRGQIGPYRNYLPDKSKPRSLDLQGFDLIAVGVASRTRPCRSTQPNPVGLSSFPMFA